MLNTISECNKRLAKVNSELARLNLERQHLLETIELLSKQNNYRTSPMSPRVLEIIKQNPGSSGREIRKLLNDELTTRRLTNVLSPLRVAGKIENRGGRGIAARWYATDKGEN